MGRSRIKKGILYLASVLLLMQTVVFCYPVHVQGVTSHSLLLSQAKSMALAGNSDYSMLKSDLALAQAEYVSAIRSIQEIKRDKSSFRYSPLLSLKFPEKANFSEESEWSIKPLQKQMKISSIQHELGDIIYEIYEEVSNLFVQVYSQQEMISFLEERLTNQKENLAKNRIRLLTGEASQKDIDTMEASVQALEDSMVAYKREFENSKAALTELTGLNVTSGYTFRNPYVEADIDREDVDWLIDYTLENSQTYYDVKLNTQLALCTMNTDYNLMYNQYGSSMNGLNTYINQAKTGKKINTSAFKLQYDAMLKKIDAPWQGSYKIRILFIKIYIPKEWFKGAISGIRYVEDDPYGLYTAVLDYQSALAEQNAVKKELEEGVKSTYETLVSTRTAYQALKKNVKDSSEKLNQAMVLNQTGELEYEELKDLQDEYEELQQDEMEALALYSQTIYSFDRLTCGAVSTFIAGTDMDTGAAYGGDSYLKEEAVEGAYYYIDYKVEDNIFDFGIFIPENFETSVTDYELWVDDTQIGERKSILASIRHLGLDMEQTQKVFIRFYDGADFVDDVEIDPTEYNGAITITGGYFVPKDEDRVVASYRYRISSVTGMITLEIDPEEKEEIAFYSVCTTDEKPIYQEELLPVGTSFQYLPLLANDWDNLVVLFYDKEKNYLYAAKFHTDQLTLQVAETESTE